MSTADTLHRIAALLPEEEKERFLLLSHKFSNFSEDDELLLLVEAICLNTLLWKEVPEQILSILSGASPIPENHERLKSMIDSSVRNAVPSYDDLKQISSKLEENILSLKKMNVARPPKRKMGKTKYIITGILIGFTLPYALNIIFPL